MNRFEPPPLPGQRHAGREPVDPYAAPQERWTARSGYAHPRGTTVLVLGILSVVLLPVLGPVAWVMARTALKEADAAPGPTTNRGSLQAGLVLGIIGTCMVLFGVVSFLLVLSFVIVVAIPV